MDKREKLNRYFQARFKSQNDAAAHYEVTQGCIAHWVNGRRRPRPDIAMRIVADSKTSRVKLSIQDIYSPQ